MGEPRPRKIGDVYWAAVEPVWESIDIYGGGARFLETYSAAEPARAQLFAAHFCQSEVCNGGLHQFFTNPTGVLAPEGAAAFHLIGLTDVARIIQEAMAWFGPEYPREQEGRQLALGRVPGETRKEWDPFCELDDRLFEALEDRRFERLADRFAEERLGIIGPGHRLDA